MYFMYTDESGDPGFYSPYTLANRRPSPHYILTGFIIPAEEWRGYLTNFIDLRRYIKSKYGFPVREELHGAELMRPRSSVAHKRIGSRRKRMALYKEVLENLYMYMPRAKIINVHLDKLKPRYASSATADIQDLVWDRLLQRYNTYLQKSCNGEMGMIFADQTNEAKIRRLLRRMRVHNYVPSRIHAGESLSAPLVNLIEDPIMRNSESSYFIQIADLVSHALFRKLYPKKVYNRHGADKLFDLVGHLLCREAASYDPQGIVRC